MKALRWIAIAATVLLAAGVIGVGGYFLWAIGGPVGILARPLPTVGEPEVDVDYRANIDCLSQFRLGDTVWRLNGGDGWPPPELVPGISEMFSVVSVPGIVRFGSLGQAVFRAQSDGSEWPAAPAVGGLADGICI